jgi:hypothetical protein
VLRLPLSPVLAIEVRVLVNQIHSLSGSIAGLEELIEEEGPKLAAYSGLVPRVQNSNEERHVTWLDELTHKEDSNGCFVQ